jgi:lipopolysaccharide biosynthesis glycosyltransferase
MQNIVYVTDNNFWMYLYVSLYSLLKNNKDEKFSVYILTDMENDNFIDKLPYLYSIGNLINCEIVKINKAMIDSFPINERLSYISKATYYRIFIGSLLPKEIKKVLYLDCDTIVEKPLNELFSLSLDQHVLAAAEDRAGVDCAKRMGLPKGFKYFNAGVMMINLEKWRSLDIEGRLLDYIKNNSDKLTYNEQDALNAVLYSEYYLISPKFNFQEYNNEIFTPHVEPYIIHYLGSPKPWSYLSEYPHGYRYWEYLKETPYQGYSESDRTFLNILIKHSRIKPALRRVKKILITNHS